MVIKTLVDTVMDICGEDISNGQDEADQILVMTNKSGYNGAITMLYKEKLKQVGDRIRNSFFIIPSSIHEVLLVPCASGVDEEILNQMVREVNSTSVNQEDYLSDHVYYYDHNENILFDSFNGNKMNLVVA